VTGAPQGGEGAAPNRQKLAREFARLENFHASGDTGADGYAWSVAAIAPSYVQKMWPATLAGRRKLADFEGQEPAATPPAGYIWTNAHSAGLSVRNYGHFVVNRPGAELKGVQVDDVRDPVLARLTNRSFRGPDAAYPDAQRAQVFVEELADYEKTGEMPRLIVMRLGGAGQAAGDTDRAIGKIVAAVSRSRFWPQTAIFVAPTDAGRADSHRAPALAISPWVTRGAVDVNMYNTASVLRTIGLLLGLRPMTHFDAAARPMTALFAAAPDARPYEAATAP
jgi:hypothetical protein